MLVILPQNGNNDDVKSQMYEKWYIGRLGVKTDFYIFWAFGLKY